MSDVTTRAAVPQGVATAAPAEAKAPAAAPAADRPKRTLMQEITVFTERFGHMMSRILLTALYVVLVAPAALFIAFLTDPLRIKRYRGTSMSPWKSENTDLDHARRQD